MDDTIAKVGGVIALAVILFWIWHNSQGTVGILESLGQGHGRVYQALAGGRL